VPVGLLALPSMAAWDARQAGQHQAVGAKAFAPHRRRHLGLAATPTPLAPLGLAINRGAQIRVYWAGVGNHPRLPAHQVRGPPDHPRNSAWACRPLCGAARP
jgi:hypothetical protein